jgi:hypothetical protein
MATMDKSSRTGFTCRAHAGRPHAASVRFIQVVLAVLLYAVGTAAAAIESGSAAMRAAYALQRVDIESNRFGKPLTLKSQQSETALKGDIHAVLDQPFDKVRTALAEPRNWCDILILHPNVKDCRFSASEPAMAVKLGRSAFDVRFGYRAVASTNDYLDVRLDTPTGPFGTTDYRIRLEAAPLDGNRTFVHLAYSHGYGMRARLAMQAYFNTLGYGKVGFTVIEKDAQGQPVYVSDLRGGLERNAMRYYASIESYLDALTAPAAQRLEKRLRHWFAYTEKYPLQLQEAAGYLEAKRKEATRVQDAS